MKDTGELLPQLDHDEDQGDNAGAGNDDIKVNYELTCWRILILQYRSQDKEFSRVDLSSVEANQDQKTNSIDWLPLTGDTHCINHSHRQ